jgi:hypothetical protein
MVLAGPDTDIADTVRDMAPHARWLMMELSIRKRYADFPVMLGLFDLMRRWGAHPDLGGWVTMMASIMAGGPEIPVEDAIRYRHAFHPNYLDLRGLGVRDVELTAVPDGVVKLVLVDCPITHAGVPQLLRLAGLTRLNAAGTRISDAGLLALDALAKLQWVCVHRTLVTPEGIARLLAVRAGLEITVESEP